MRKTILAVKQDIHMAKQVNLFMRMRQQTKICKGEIICSGWMVNK